MYVLTYCYTVKDALGQTRRSGTDVHVAQVRSVQSHVQPVARVELGRSKSFQALEMVQYLEESHGNHHDERSQKGCTPFAFDPLKR